MGAQPDDLVRDATGGFRLLVTSWRLGRFEFDLIKRSQSFVASAMQLLGGR